MARQRVDDRPSRIAKPQQLGNFVISFSRGIVSRAPDVYIAPAMLTLLRQKQVRVSRSSAACSVLPTRSSTTAR